MTTPKPGYMDKSRLALCTCTAQSPIATFHARECAYRIELEKEGATIPDQTPHVERKPAVTADLAAMRDRVMKELEPTPIDRTPDFPDTDHVADQAAFKQLAPGDTLEQRKTEGLSSAPEGKPKGQTPEDKAIQVIDTDTLEEDKQWLKDRTRKKSGAEEAREYTDTYGTPRKGPPIVDGLTVKQDQFCKLVAYGDSYGAAYASAFKPPKSSKRTIERSASELASRANIKERIQHYLDQINNKELRAATRSVERWFDSVWSLADGADTDATKATALRLIRQALRIAKHVNVEQPTESAAELEKQLMSKLKDLMKKASD